MRFTSAANRPALFAWWGIRKSPTVTTVSEVALYRRGSACHPGCQNLRSIDAPYVRGKPGTPVTRPSEVVISLTET